MYASLRRNLFEAFGGTARVFLLLKTYNVAAKHAGFFPTSAAADLAGGNALSDAAAAAALAPALAALRPLLADVRLLNASDDAPERLLNRGCRLQRHHRGAPVYITEAGLVRMFGQAQSTARCMRMIERHECAARKAHAATAPAVRSPVASPAPIAPCARIWQARARRRLALRLRDARTARPRRPRAGAELASLHGAGRGVPARA